MAVEGPSVCDLMAIHSPHYTTAPFRDRVAGTSAPEWMPAPASKAGADGADCNEVACRSRADMFKAMRRTVDGASGAPAEPLECPPMREDLGRCTWTLVR